MIESDSKIDLVAREASLRPQLLSKDQSGEKKPDPTPVGVAGPCSGRGHVATAQRAVG